MLPFNMGYTVQEAAYHSVPVISVPLSLGQEEISQFAVDQGRGIVLRKETLMAGHSQPLLNALRDIVVHNSAYKKQVWLVMTAVLYNWLF
jgi:UDP-N-acetylglucosamine:LPS N-acetylglucosamine transferase